MDIRTATDRGVHTLINQVITGQDNFIDEILLERYIIDAIEDDDYSFSSGLLGIGWFISYLDYEKILQIDLDEVLYDFDDNLYKIALKVIVDDNASIEEVTYLITYFHQRYLNKNNFRNNYRRFPIYECLKMLMEKCVTLLSVNFRVYSQIILTRTLLKISFVGVKAYENKQGEEVFFTAIETLLNEYFASDKILSDKDIEVLYYLLIAIKQYHHPLWENLIRDILVRSRNNNFKIKILEEVSQIESTTKAIKLLDIYDATKINDDEFLTTLLSNTKFVKV